MYIVTLLGVTLVRGSLVTRGDLSTPVGAGRLCTMQCSTDDIAESEVMSGKLQYPSVLSKIFKNTINICHFSSITFHD